MTANKGVATRALGVNTTGQPFITTNLGKVSVPSIRVLGPKVSPTNSLETFKDMAANNE